MDVRQYAFLARQTSATVKTREHFWGMPKRGVAFLLANVMFWQPLWAQAEGIVVATPGTTLDHAGNGVQIVNIATPNGSGLSHNQFHDYNVGAQGLILNNGSVQTSLTQLGGIIIGNPHLKNSGSAQTILNEVIGGSPSQLRGYTEVAGQSARVIVANPYGITCNGCGFINTPRVTLTSGKPVLDGAGRVDRFQVDRGSIAIEGAGLNASNIDRFEIITRSAKVNAEIQANNLTIVAGRNDVNAQTLNATARADDGSAKPQLAIDSSALGGMYAGAIRLVGTEAGVGVKVDGNLAASAGDIQIDANGHLSLAQTSAAGAVNVQAASLDAQGPVYAGTAVNVKTQGNLTNQKTLAARDSITLNAGGQLTNNGVIEAGVNADASRNKSGDVSLTTQNLVNTGKSVVASRDLTIDTQQTVNNQGGTLSAERLSLKADQVLNDQGGLIKGQATLDATLKHLSNNAGEVSSQGNSTLILGSLDNSSGVLMAQMGLDLSASDVMNNRGGLISGWQGLTIKGTRLDNSNNGTLSSRSGDVDIRLTDALLNNAAGALVSQKALTVHAASLDNSAKGIVSSATEQTIILSGLLDNSGEGLLDSGAALTLQAMALNNIGGKVNASGDLQFTGTELNNSQGTFIGKQAITLDLLGALINSGGQLSGAGPVLILRSTRVDNQGGELSSQSLLSLLTGNLDNSEHGTLAANDKLLISASGLVSNGNGGLIASRNADLELSAASVANAKGQLQAKSALQLNVSGNIDNQSGQIVAKEGELSLKAANLDNQSGHIAALNSDASIETAANGSFNNRDGGLYAKTLLQVGAKDLDNRGGQISASRIGLNLQGALNNRNGLIESLGTLATTAASLDNQNGQLRALGTSQKTLFNIVGTFNNRDGRLEAANTDLSIEAGGLQNQGGNLLHAGTGVFGISMANLNDVGGRLVTQGDLILDADDWTNSTSIQAERLTVNVKHLTQTGTGQLLAATHLEGTGTDWRNDGLIGSDGDISLDLTGNYKGKGRLSSLGTLDLHAASLDLESSASIAGGGDTTIDIDALLNNAGRITSSENLTLTATGINNSGTVGSGKDLTVNTGALLNDHGLISSGGNLQLLVSSFTNRYAQVYSLGSVLIAKDTNQTKADLLDNRSGAIESLGQMTIAATTVNNVMDVLEYTAHEKSATSITRLPCEWIPVAGCDARGGGRINGLWEIAETDRLRVTKSSAASSLSSGADLLINTQTLNNTSSTVAATGNLQVNATTINNKGLQPQEIQTLRRYWSFVNETGNAEALAATFNARNNPNPSATVESDLSAFLGWMGVLLAQNSTVTNGDQSFAAILQAGGNVSLNAGQTVNNSVVRSFYAYVGPGQTHADTSAGSGYSTPISINPQLPPEIAQQQVNPVTLPGFTLPTSPNGLFRLSTQGSSTPAPNPWAIAGLPDNSTQSKPHKYLIETNPALTDLKQFMSSDYLLSNLGYDPDLSAKRLGDGLYEQRMIQQAVVARTGQRFIDGQDTDEKLFKYLMDNAVQSKQSLNLSVGVSLTAEQVAALTHDIVWLESHEVNGEQVLVPVLYLAHSDNRLAPTGALIAGKDVSLISGQNLNNVGTLRASNNLSAVAGESIVNSGLAEADKRLDLLAGNNLVNRAGGIIAGRDVSLTATQGDVINERTVTSHQSSGGAYTQQAQRDFVDSAARIEADNNLTINAGRDVNNLGSVLKSSADTTITAGRDVNLTSVEQVVSNEQSQHRDQTVTQHGSDVEVGQDFKVTAGRDLAIIASQVDVKRDVSMSAVGDLTLASAADEQHSYTKTKKFTGQDDHVRQVSSTVNAGGNITLNAGKDLNLIASRVNAGNEAYLFAGDNVNMTTADNVDYSYYSKTKKGSWGKKKSTMTETETDISVSSSVSATNKLVISAGEDFNATGAKLKSDGTLLATAGGDINLDAAQDYASQASASSKKGWSSSKSSSSEVTQTRLNSTELIGKNIELKADNDISLKAAALRAEEGVKLTAGNDVLIGADHETQTSAQSKGSSKAGVTVTGWLSSTQKSQQGQTTSTQSVGSDISGSSIQIKSGRDTAVEGSTLVADKDIGINAGRNLEITSAENTETSSSKSGSKKIGEVGTSWWQGATGVLKQKETDEFTSTRQSASQIASLGGNISLIAGDHYIQTASQLVAPQGDIGITAKHVDIEAGYDTLESTKTASTSRTAIGGTVSIPLLDALRSIKQMGEAAQKTSDDRMVALAAVNAAMSAKQALDAGQALMDAPKTGIKISVNLSDSRSHSESSQSGRNVVGSDVVAGGNVKVVATGDGANSDINVVGSRIEGGGNVSLKADGEINLLSAQNTAHQESTNGNSGWSAGIGIGFGGAQNGISFELAANVGRGMADGDDVAHTNTYIKGGNSVKLESGGDTNIKGGVVSADQVKVKVGGDLNIESQQDTSTFTSKQLSANVGINICVPPICAGMSSVSGGVAAQHMQSDYASVSEQSGIKAGNGGFQVEVAGNTDLKGAVIASTEKAVTDSKNTLSTGTLTSSDIKNKADYDAASINLSGGYGGKIGLDGKGNVSATANANGASAPSKGGGSANIPVVLYAGDSSSSTTHSGISGAAVTITNTSKQQQLTGQTAEQAVAAINADVSSDRDSSNKLKPIFDAQEIGVDFEIVGKFVQNVSQYIQSRAQEIDQKKEQAEKEKALSSAPELSPDQQIQHHENYLVLKQQIREMDKNWGAGGTYRQIATALVAGISGNVAGSGAQFAQNMVVNYVQQQGSAYIGELVKKGLKEGSSEHAALHAILGCAGAAASNQSCSAGALGGSAASVLAGLFADSDPNETAVEREAKRNLITSLVTGIAAMSNPNGAATANNAATANVDNNWLATQQYVQAKKEIDAEPNLLKKLAIVSKWQITSLRQDVLTGSGILKGFKDGMAGAGLGTLDSAVIFMSDPVQSWEAVKEFASSDEAKAILGNAIAAAFKSQVDQIGKAIVEGGDANAENLGNQMGQALALVVQLLAGGGSSSANSALTLSRMGIDVSVNTVKKIVTSVDINVVKTQINKLQDLMPDPDVPIYVPPLITAETLSRDIVNKVLSIEKGARPLPETYLSQTYRDMHARMFDEGVVRIQPSAPTGTIGRTETWVLPKSVAQDAISRANGDVSKLEQYLGLDKGYLGNSPVLVNITKVDGYRIPSGNEFGANDFWRPGGYTSPGGLPEAVINPVQPGDYTISSIFK
jgi:filamentous hemagglutinin